MNAYENAMSRFNEMQKKNNYLFQLPETISFTRGNQCEFELLVDEVAKNNPDFSAVCLLDYLTRHDVTGYIFEFFLPNLVDLLTKNEDYKISSVAAAIIVHQPIRQSYFVTTLAQSGKRVSNKLLQQARRKLKEIALNENNEMQFRRVCYSTLLYSCGVDIVSLINDFDLDLNLVNKLC